MNDIQDNSEGEKYFSQEINNAEASVKVDPTLVDGAEIGDIHKKYDSEGMCVES